MSIAFFDSGIGGLTVLKTALNLLPDECYIYYADTKNLPYGIKPREEIKKYIFDSIEFLSKKNIKILVLACNTATAVALEDLKKMYDFPIIGMEPAIKSAIRKNKDKRILVLATTLTLKEQKLNSLIKSCSSNNRVEKQALDELVLFAERFEFNSSKVVRYIRSQFNTINLDEYGTIILGCTHFIYFKPIFRKIMPITIDIIDGNEDTVKKMVSELTKNSLLNLKNERNLVLYSSRTMDDNERAERLKEILFEKSSVIL
jgi:glutamate racemase